MSQRARRRRSREDRLDPSLTRFRFRQLHNPLPPTEILGPALLDELHLASMHILENTGIDFLDEETLLLWEKAGARVDHQARHVWLDRGLVLELVAQAPAEFTLRARNPAHNLTLGGNRITFAPMGGMVNIATLQTGRRASTLADAIELTKILQMAPMIHTGGAGIALGDVPVSVRHLRRALAYYPLTDKAMYANPHGRVIPEDELAMARIVFGDPLPADPVLSGVVNVNSPLRFDKRMLGGLMTMARAGQVVVLTPFILAGAMSPITIAAALAQQNAEALAGIALTQLIRPGAPVVYGGFTTNTDMKTGSPSFGTPEGAWALLVGAQLARRYGLPYRGSGSLCSANTPDAQAAAETMWSMWPAILAHTNLVMHSIGWLENGLTVSYEKMILDLENVLKFYSFLEGFQINEATLALDMIDAVGPGGHHFGTPHTQARFSSEFYQSILGSHPGFESWLAAGAEDAVTRANKVWQALLRQYEQPALDVGIVTGLTDFVARREQELAGVDLYYDA
ncbi:MAG: trimethylamine methyltransferase family protein [Anaerolineales bacterium]|nr:trimethylamine methyltransferase family protein [Anaerolineales bacterium]